MAEESSLKRFDRPADRIRQDRSARLVPALLVEGESDYHVLRQVLPESLIIPCGTRGVAIGEAQTLSAWRITHFACVVDADFDDLSQDKHQLGRRLHPYDNADLESMLIGLGVLDAIIAQVSSQAKLAKSGGPAAVREKLTSAVKPVGTLRRLNADNGWGLPFDKVDLSAKIDKKTLEVNLIGYCDALIAASADPPARGDVALLLTGAQHDAVRGKDVCVALVVALRQYVGTNKHSVISADFVAGALRAAGGYALSISRWAAELRNVLAA